MHTCYDELTCLDRWATAIENPKCMKCNQCTFSMNNSNVWRDTCLTRISCSLGNGTDPSSLIFFVSGMFIIVFWFLFANYTSSFSFISHCVMLQKLQKACERFCSWLTFQSVPSHRYFSCGITVKCILWGPVYCFMLGVCSQCIDGNAVMAIFCP